MLDLLYIYLLFIPIVEKTPYVTMLHVTMLHSNIFSYPNTLAPMIRMIELADLKT